MNTRFAGIVAVLLLATRLGAAEPATLDVWPGKAPGDTGGIGKEHVLPERPNARKVQRITNVTHPTLKVFRPDPQKDTGASVLICPGGGYHILAWDLEGEEVAQWLNTIGVTGIVLKYRVPRRKNLEKHELPLQDAQRAMSLVRSKAEAWKLDPERIGILGFSAGGHLAAAASTNFDKRSYDAVDEVDEVSCRPDFAVLVYPAYLLGKDSGLAPEIRVDKRTPPTFLVHASNDGLTAENSAAYYIALKRADVNSELHIYSTGGHGFGLRPSQDACSTWPQRCETWLKSRGWLEPRK